jgi:predicted nucleic acid-binding protein
VRYRAALDAGALTEQRVDDPNEIDIFLRLGRHPRLGAGERSAIAVALNRGHMLAIDDNRAITKALHEAGLSGAKLPIIRTQDIVVALIRAGILTVEAADAILADWAANHRFKLKIGSFAELAGKR